MKNLVPRPAQLSRDGKRLVRDWMGSDGKVFPLPLNTNKNAKSSIVDIYGDAFTSVVGKNPTMKVNDYGESVRLYDKKKEPTTTKSNLFRSVGRWKPDLESDKPLDIKDLASISVSADRKKVIDAFTKGKINKEEYEERLKKLARSPAIVSVKNSKGEHIYAKNVKYSADAKKGGLYLPQSPDEPRQIIATLKGKKKTNIDPDSQEPAGYIKTPKGRKPVYETLGIGFSQTPFLLCDFDAGHPDHISIPPKQWSQIPTKLRKQIRTIEKKGVGDLQGVYRQARQYADFGKPKDSPRWREIVSQVKASDKGGATGKWSAVKASIATRKYKAEGGGYTTKKPKQKGIRNWFSQNSSSLQKQKGDS